MIIMRSITEPETYELIARNGCQPFSYDRDDGVFIVGENIFPLSPDFGYDVFEVMKGVPKLSSEEIRRHPLVHNFSGDTYALPRLLAYYIAMDPGQLEGLRRDLAETMHEALAAMTEEEFVPDYDGAYEAFVIPGKAYEARILGSPSLHPLAVGGSLGEAGWYYNIFEYTMNNADMPEWEVTLYTGIGRLAALSVQGA